MIAATGTAALWFVWHHPPVEVDARRDMNAASDAEPTPERPGRDVFDHVEERRLGLTSARALLNESPAILWERRDVPLRVWRSPSDAHPVPGARFYDSGSIVGVGRVQPELALGLAATLAVNPIPESPTFYTPDEVLSTSRWVRLGRVSPR